MLWGVWGACTHALVPQSGAPVSWNGLSCVRPAHKEPYTGVWKRSLPCGAGHSGGSGPGEGRAVAGTGATKCHWPQTCGARSSGAPRTLAHGRRGAAAGHGGNNRPKKRWEESKTAFGVVRGGGRLSCAPAAGPSCERVLAARPGSRGCWCDVLTGHVSRGAASRSGQCSGTWGRRLLPSGPGVPGLGVIFSRGRGIPHAPACWKRSESLCEWTALRFLAPCPPLQQGPGWGEPAVHRSLLTSCQAGSGSRGANGPVAGVLLGVMSALAVPPRPGVAPGSWAG